MPNTTFVDGGAPVTAAWLNDVNFVIYDLLGNGTLVPASRAELAANTGTGGGGGGATGNSTFQQETPPSSPSIGDLWQVPSTGIMSRWNGTAWIVFGDIAQPDAAAAAAEAATAISTANAASTAATTANTAITAIASDNVLSSGEKSAIILDYSNLATEAVGIDNQAVAFGVVTEKAAYDLALNTLTVYLATLVAPTLWSDVSGNTTIVGTTFRANFANVYATRQTLLNKIAAVAKAIADTGVANAATAASAAATAATAAANAQTTANNASTNAASALNQLTNIASDNILSQVEKSAVILDYTNLTAEQADIDAKATTYAITTQKTNYDNALAALTTYLGGLTTPVAWNNLTGDTTIVGSTFRTEFAAVYSTRQLLLNEIARVAGTVAAWTGVSGISVTTGQIFPGAVSDTSISFAAAGHITSGSGGGTGGGTAVPGDVTVTALALSYTNPTAAAIPVIVDASLLNCVRTTWNVAAPTVTVTLEMTNNGTLTTYILGQFQGDNVSKEPNSITLPGLVEVLGAGNILSANLKIRSQAAAASGSDWNASFLRFAALKR